MKRIYLTDGSGRFFDIEKSEFFKEERRFNGSNFISVNTGCQFTHEKLYKTAGGLYVKCCYSDYQGLYPTYETIETVEAYEWLSKNEYENEVPEAEKAAYNKKYEI